MIFNQYNDRCIQTRKPGTSSTLPSRISYAIRDRTIGMCGSAKRNSPGFTRDAKWFAIWHIDI